MLEQQMELETVLIFQDPDANSRIDECVERAGLSYVIHSDLDGAIRRLYSSNIKVVLLDDDRAGEPSTEVVKQLRRVFPSIQILVLVKSITTQRIIDHIKEGAFDVVADYRLPDRLAQLIRKAAEAARSYAEQRSEPRAAFDYEEETTSIIGQSAEMIEIYKAIGQVARSNATVLIEGETGTGKELVADEIVANSLRADAPFHKLNCAALPETLLESELFGHERGSFTDAKARKIGKFELCNGGTIFLDEIGDMSPAIQAKVLRVLQEQSFERVGGNETIRVDVRVIAATNKSLLQLSKRNEFRWDLFYRLKVINLHLPALRERGDDIMLLARHFLRKYARAMNKDVRHFAPETVEILNTHTWPGNVRELQNTIEAAVVRANGNTILPDHLPEGLADLDPSRASSAAMDGDWARLLQRIVDDQFDNLLRRCRGNLYGAMTSALEASLIRRTLQETRGNQVQAAKLLGISRNTLRDRIDKFDMAQVAP